MEKTCFDVMTVVVEVHKVHFPPNLFNKNYVLSNCYFYLKKIKVDQNEGI